MKLSVTLLSVSILLSAPNVLGQTIYNSFINCISPASVPSGTVSIGAGAATSDACVVSDGLQRNLLFRNPR